MLNRKLGYMVVLLVCGAMIGCAGTKVKRVDVEEAVDLSGRWNDTDAQMVATEMIDDALMRPWLEDFRAQAQRAPVVTVGPVLNQSHEHINADVFVKSVERSLLNSGRVKFVAARDERPDVRAERAEQHEGLTDPATIKAMGKEVGADYILIGSINSVKDETKGRYVILYQVNLELIDIETNQKAWIGQKMIKKVVKSSKYSL